MKITRLYAGDDGESHFEEIEVETEKTQPVEGMIFRQVPPGHVWDWHRPPQRQYVITLSGQAEIEIGDGTKKTLRPGTIMLVDDTTGRGHITRVIGTEPRLYAAIPVKSVRDRRA
ncbi:MAG: cupin domain-containing protein [Deltaproteobacteria bacterium]|nr:cupin domain-containing protein [Deltaproteobacteria bacterium]